MNIPVETSASLLAVLLGEYDAREVHCIGVRASRDRVFAAVEEADVGGVLVKALLAARTVPAVLRFPRRGVARLRQQFGEPLTLSTFRRSGFGLVAREPAQELILGLQGQFWRPVAPIQPIGAEEAHTPIPVGVARALWRFTIRDEGNGLTRLCTETRVKCGDEASRRRFRRYWWLIRPASGLLRHLMLRRMRQWAEHGREVRS